MEVFLEIRPRLKVANGVVTRRKKNTKDENASLVDFEKELDIGCDSRGISINSQIFSSPPQFKLKESSLTVGSVEKSAASFRVELIDNSNPGHSIEILENSSPVYRSMYKVTQPTITKDQEYELLCSECGSKVGGVSPQRILPQPSPGWRQESANWFCCVNKLDKPPDINLKDTDILYGAATTSFSVDVLLPPQNLPQASACQSLLCPACGCCLGDREEGEPRIVNLWNSAVNYHLPTTGALTNRSAGIPLNPRVLSHKDTFACLLCSTLAGSLEIMPRFLFKDRSSSETNTRASLAVWVVDKALTVLFSIGGQLHQCTVVKLLFKLVQPTSEPPTGTVIFLSEEILKSAITTLEESTDSFPASAKFVQDFQVGFITHL